VDDVALGKADVIERCVARVRGAYREGGEAFLADVDRQDVVVLNLQRACEAAIDLAMHLVRSDRLGVPTSSAEAFDLLERAGSITPEAAKHLRAMVGFRNVAVHDYRRLDWQIVQGIVAERLSDLLAFARLGVARAARRT
jgi:uncharacterized protein YutE (UPF0331/DUF86 family)